MKRSSIVMLTIFFALSVVVLEDGGQAAEKKYPVKPITFISPVEAGAGAYVQAQPLVDKLSTLLGVPIMYVAKPGAGSSIANKTVHDAKPDGYTIGNGTVSIVSNKLMGLLPYDFRDFTILGAFLDAVSIIVSSPKTPRNFKTLEEVITYAKAHPGDITMAAGSKGQTWWIAAMEFQQLAGVKFNTIPQEGAGAISIAQVAGGHTDLGCLGLAEGKGQIDAGNARFLATFGKRRPFSYPNVPTLNELGYPVKLSSLNVVMGPPGLPKDVVDTLVKAVEVAAKDPDYKKFLEERNNTMSIYLTPEQAIKQYHEVREVFKDILGKTGLLKEK